MKNLDLTFHMQASLELAFYHLRDFYFFYFEMKDECIKFVTRATVLFVFHIDFKSFGIWRGLKLVMNVVREGTHV